MSPMEFQMKKKIANRGEIALRIIRACKELDITSVAIFSEADIHGVWVRKAGRALDEYIIEGVTTNIPCTGR